MSMSFEEFVSFYSAKGFLPNDIGIRKNSLNSKQIKSRYEKYLKSETKKQEARERYLSLDEKWEALKEQLDLTSCSLYETFLVNGLTNAAADLKNNAGYLLYQVDAAHVFGRGAYPHMKYDVDNVVPLNRYSHSNLDQMRDPITGEQISCEDKLSWWKFIVGEKKYNNLLLRSNN